MFWIQITHWHTLLNKVQNEFIFGQLNNCYLLKEVIVDAINLLLLLLLLNYECRPYAIFVIRILHFSLLQ